MATHTLATIAEALGGELHGEPTLAIERVRELQEAGPHDIALVMEKKREAAVATSSAGAFVLSEGAPPLAKPHIRVRDPRRALIALLNLLHPEKRRPAGVAPGAHVSPGATLGEGVSVGAGAVVEIGAVVGARCQIHPNAVVGEGVVMGDDCVVFPNVTLYEGTRLGNRVRIHAGTVVGGDGFGYQRDEKGAQLKVPQVGGVTIEDDVEIGANSAVDRATLGTTRIGRGTKIDNLVQIAHNVTIGEHACLVSQVGIAGSATLGAFTVLAGQSGVGPHVTLEPGVVVGAQAGVPSDLKKGTYLGSPAIPAREAGRSFAVIAKLPEMRQELRRLTERCATLEAELLALKARLPE